MKTNSVDVVNRFKTVLTLNDPLAEDLLASSWSELSHGREIQHLFMNATQQASIGSRMTHPSRCIAICPWSAVSRISANRWE